MTLRTRVADSLDRVRLRLAAAAAAVLRAARTVGGAARGTPATDALQGVLAIAAVGAGVELERWGLALVGGLVFLDYAAGAWPRDWRQR